MAQLLELHSTFGASDAVTPQRGAGPSNSARYTGDGHIEALFGALDLQKHRTLGIMDSINQVQDQQGVTHNLILETRATVDRMQEQNLMYYNWRGY
ncbi:hypothetical protein U9M48_038892 [Paspalum notatum var. saurae]|uniref:Uncharacterized protein n=1 Tax=Paspalum notatum var. saurae TaxID=547442 RepID=A0AAQ3XAU5_PASNO